MNIVCNVYLPEAVLSSLQQKLENDLAGETIVFKNIWPHEQWHNVQADIVIYPANVNTISNLATCAVVGINYANNYVVFPAGFINGQETITLYYFNNIDIEAVALFLSKALPQPVNNGFRFIKKDIEELTALFDDGVEDAFILPAGFLQQYHVYDTHKAGVLKSCRQMVLPLLDCPPIPFSSFIIAEPRNNDTKNLKAVKAINNNYLKHQLLEERALYNKLSAENNHVFTQTIFVSDAEAFHYAVYKDTHNKKAEIWEPLPEFPEAKKLFSSTGFMGSFFNISPLPYQLTQAPIVYIANYKALHSLNNWQDKTVWASGSKTWLEAAKKGIWVTGCADAFGLEYLERIWGLPLHRIDKKEVQLLTNNSGAELWQQKGWDALACYQLEEQENKELQDAVGKAEIFFWTSIQQYKAVEKYIQPNAVHYCPYGETAQQFKNMGIAVTVLPNIKAFKIWNKNTL